MRTVTLGVLILILGTLAALPFRRYTPVTAPSAPDEACGPTESSIQGSKLEMVQAREIPKIESMSLQSLPEWKPTPKVPARVGVPMTYEQLAVPVQDHPEGVNPFPAMVSAQQETRREDQSTLASIEPLMQNFAVNAPKNSPISQPTTLSSQQDPIVATNQELPRASGQLASTTSTSPQDQEPKLPRVEKRTTAERPEPRRYWIRQPK